MPREVTLKLRNRFTDFYYLVHCLPISHQEQDPHKGNRVNDTGTDPDICSRDTQGGTSLVNTGQAIWSPDTLCPEDREGLYAEGPAGRQRVKGQVLRKGASCCLRGTHSQSLLLGWLAWVPRQASLDGRDCAWAAYSCQVW